MPKATRAELHERFAVWMEEHATGLVELDEIAGWHLEQAVRYAQELGLAADPALARRAAERLLAAGRRARNRSDITAARNLLERAHDIAPADDRLRVRIGVELAEELMVAGELSRADELLSAGEQDSETALPAALTRLEWLNNARPEGAEHRIQSLLPGMLEQLAERGDQRGLAKAHMASFWAHWSRSQALPAARELRLAAEHAAWARSAVDRAFETDFPFARGEALVTLALVLEKLDRRQESMTAARRALELYEAKCDRPGASQARLLLERLDAVA